MGRKLREERERTAMVVASTVTGARDRDEKSKGSSEYSDRLMS